MSKSSSVWTCVDCGGKVAMSFEEVKVHLVDVHGLIEGESMKAKRTMTQHLDGEKASSSLFEIQVRKPGGGIVNLLNTVVVVRDWIGQDSQGG
jgi:hypothetical protein